MLITYDIQKINKVLNDFYCATGVHIDLYSVNFLPISYNQHTICNYCRHVQSNPVCKKACVNFDEMLLNRSLKSMQVEQDTCAFGLNNIVSPIIYNNQVIAYLFFGQMKMSADLPKLDPCAEDSHIEKDKLFEYYAALPLFDNEKAQSISNLAKMLIGQILAENMLKPDYGEMLQKAVTYICDNLDKNLSIENISTNVNVSKSVLYSKFHAHFGCTIGEFINKKRIEKSVEFLTKSALSIEEISQKTGFSSASYYTKIFKQHMGITPLKFKKSQTL